MKTRSQTKLEEVANTFVIDFDEASEAWMANKIRIGASYKYVCQKPGRKGCRCISQCLPGEDYCKTHLQMIKKQAAVNNK